MFRIATVVSKLDLASVEDAPSSPSLGTAMPQSPALCPTVIGVTRRTLPESLLPSAVDPSVVQQNSSKHKADRKR